MFRNFCCSIFGIFRFAGLIFFDYPLWRRFSPQLSILNWFLSFGFFFFIFIFGFFLFLFYDLFFLLINALFRIVRYLYNLDFFLCCVSLVYCFILVVDVNFHFFLSRKRFWLFTYVSFIFYSTYIFSASQYLRKCFNILLSRFSYFLILRW